MFRTLWLTALLGLAPLAAAGAQTTADPPTPPGLDRLVEQLGDADYRKRDLAIQQLAAHGLKALPALKAALNHPDAEVRRRIHDLIPALETAAVLAPRRVTLKIGDRPLKEVFDALEKQTSYKVEFWGGDARKTYSFDFNDVPFWQALDAICSATGMVLQQGYGDDRIRLQHQEGHVPFVRYDGSFRLTPTGFQHYRNIDFGLIGKGGAGNRRSETLTLTFAVFSEPRLPMLGMGEVKLDAAYDTDKNSMLLPTGNGEEHFDGRWGMRGRWTSRYGHGNRSASMQTQVTLARPSERATGVKLVRGSIPVTLLAEQKPVVVTDKILAAKGKKNKIDTTSFTIEEVGEMAGKQVQVKMTITEATDNPNDYTWMNALYQRIELQDAKGNKFQVVGSGWGNNAPGTVQMTLTFSPQGNAKVGPPDKLIYYSWTTLQHQIAFEFRDLPLP